MITFDQKIADYFNSLSVNGWPYGNLILCGIALVLCILLIGMIGIEREKRGRSAGLRTHLLVGVSSTIIMIISIYGFPQIFADHRDVARLAAQIVTGVGFLGAGAIIHGSSGIKGLTTAGTIWASMAIGVACGSFNFILAIVGTLLIVIVLTVFKKIEVKITKKSPTFIINARTDEPTVAKILNVCKKHNCSMNHITVSKVESGKEDAIQIIFQVNFEDKVGNLDVLINDLTEEVKPISISLLNHI